MSDMQWSLKVEELCAGGSKPGICSRTAHLVVGEQKHEVQQSRQLQILSAGLLPAAPFLALLALQPLHNQCKRVLVCPAA